MPSPQAPGWPAISAHRGGRETAAAGTWAAFRDSLDSGAEYVEFDVRRTRDGRWVVHHDAYAGKLGIRPRAVRALSYDQLCKVAGYQVPDALELMEALAGRVTAHLDLKEHTDEETIVGPAVDIFGVGGLVVSTEHAASISRIRSFVPTVHTGLSTGRRILDRSRLELLKRRFDVRHVLDCGAHSVVLNHDLATDAALRRYREHGVGVMLWTVNNPAAMVRHLADPRIDVLITDHPRLARRVRDLLPAAARPHARAS